MSFVEENLNLESTRHCPQKEFCSGCQFLGQSLSQQKDFKIKKLSDALASLNLNPKKVEFISPGDFGLRDRLDFVIEEGRFGLFNPTTKRIEDLENCGQLSPTLHNFYLEFRKISWPIKKGSFRLRVGPDGSRGAWLDFANQDIKALLEEQTSLRQLMKMAFVEIGQKGKALIEKNGGLKLADPQFKEWFATRLQGKDFPLVSSVSSFTQPSLQANLMLGKILEDHYRDQKLSKVIEFGAGIGNLSFVFLNQCESFQALEFDSLAVQALKENLKRSGQAKKVEVLTGDFQKKNDFHLDNADLLILNPPRSGLGKFLEPLVNGPTGPNEIFLMSCFLESWKKDAETLNKKGYLLQRVALFDQFPQTQHFEILSFWRRSI